MTCATPLLEKNPLSLVIGLYGIVAFTFVLKSSPFLISAAGSWKGIEADWSSPHEAGTVVVNGPSYG